MKRLTTIIATVLILSGCSKFTPVKQPLVEISAKTTALANSNHVTQSEYKNKIRVDTNSLGLNINKGMFHGAYLYENKRSKGDDTSNGVSLINTDHNWLGVGVHTNKGTYLTYYRDLSHKLWMIDINANLKVPNSKLRIITGIYHLDKNGGTLAKSGGRRTTGIRIGAERIINDYLSLEAILEIQNNGAVFTEDRFLTGVKFRWW